MNFGLTEEQLLFKQTLRRFLEERCPTARVRAVMESETGHDATLWAGLAELGVPGLVVPAEQGGAGLELLDAALAAEELGYAAAPGPFLACAMAAAALRASGAKGSAAAWLARLAAGDALVTVAIGEDAAEWSPERLKARATGGRLAGRKSVVPYAAVADAFLVAARDDDGPGLWLVEKGVPGVGVAALHAVDQTRRIASLELRDVPAEKLPDGAAALRRAIDAGLVLVAADAYGGARRCLDMTVRYALEREQFGQKIGAFQAVKHQLANLACDLEPSLALWWHAAHAYDRIPADSERHAALAKAHLTDLFDRVARESTELHGGIGFTWEFDLQLWFRRAVFDRGFLGEASFHRARAADLAGW